MFSDVILVSNYHGCKEEVRNLVPHYLIDITYKIVAEAITFRIIAIVPNGNKLFFQIIFIFSDWILIEQIMIEYDFWILIEQTPSVLGETSSQKLLPGVLSGWLGHE